MPSSLSASSVTARASASASAVNGSIASVAAWPPREILHAPRTYPSTSSGPLAEHPPAVLLGDHARAVGVGEQQVVVLGQEAGRRGRLGVGPGRIGQVEQLAALLVGERAQPRSQPVDHLAHAGEARPRPDVGDRGGAERGEVAEHHSSRERSGGAVGPPSQESMVAQRAGPVEPHTPRGGTCTTGRR